MTINKLPGVYYTESVDFELVGEGSKIPLFIGATGNTVTTPTVRKYKNWKEVNTSIADGGIGVYDDTTTNRLSKVLKEFFEEAQMNTSSDIGVPHIYVIDVGAGSDKDTWVSAFNLAKTKLDVSLEVYVGLENVSGDYTWKDLVESAYTSISSEAQNLKLRCAITTNFTADTDTKLVNLTNETNGVQKQRIAIAEPTLFGKTVARICVTPFNMEPGYYTYRSVEAGVFTERTLAQQLTLQTAGIIINRDEIVGDKVYPKILLGVCSCFASNPRPADSLLHTRYNADHLLRLVFDAVYPQIKNNETATNIAILQTTIDGIVDEEVMAGNMIKYNEDTRDGTKLKLVESDSNPYDMVITGQIQPVNSTIAIQVQGTIQTAVMTTT